MANYNCIAGIDYGSKLAGTTAISILKNQEIIIHQSAKKQDADLLLENLIKKYNPEVIGFDAPLSLPGVYTKQKDKTDYFYREADRQLKAMSPMFLGGLTARAMALKAKLETNKTKFIETYPAKIAEGLGLKELGYKKEKENIAACLKVLKTQLPYTVQTALTDWHALDSLLALLGAYKYITGIAQKVGNVNEGVIYF